MRKALKILAGLLVVLVIILLAAPFFLDVNRYHDRIQAELQKKLGRQVSLGTMHLKLIPFAFRVENAVVGEDPNFGKGSNFAQANELYVTAALMPRYFAPCAWQASSTSGRLCLRARARSGSRSAGWP